MPNAPTALRRRVSIGYRAGLSALAAALLITPALGAQQFDESMYDVLSWTNIGPDRGGRATAVGGSESRPLEYYFGAAGGGVWKTTDAGLNWSNVSDGFLNTSSVGAIAVCEANPNVVYIGTGETELRGNIMQGDGVYKSTDAGETWTHLGLASSQNIARVRVHPTDCNTAWVAAFGQHSAPNPERGIYKTTDGGDSWDLTLFKSDKAGGVDLAVDPNNPDILFAGIWEAFRLSWGMSSGGPESGLWRSDDGGETWTDISRAEGLPQGGVYGKIGVSVSAADSDRVYAILEHAEEGGVYTSMDGGRSWEHTSDDRNLRQRAFYYSRIYADPIEVDRVYVLNVGFHRSDDGGRGFGRRISVPHGDNHDLWISRTDNQRMVEANDGGGNVSFNGGQSWTDQDFSTAQFYRVTTTNHEPYHICGAQQDNSTLCVPSGGWGHISRDYSYSVGGGESGYIASNPNDPDIFYAGSYGGSLSRFDHRTGTRRQINIWPENPMGQSSEDLVERAQWTFPIVFSNHDSGVLYSTTQKVWKTTNEGGSWTAISPDLTRADPNTLGPSGGPVTLDQTGVETYATVFALAPSFHDPAVIWAGSDDGLVHVTRNALDASPDWTNVTPPDAPDHVRINTIDASPTTPGKAYVAGIRYLVDNDRSPYIWKTEDYGQSWTKIVNGIPGDDFIRAVREDPKRPGLLYAASETTVYVSWNDGASWGPLTMNLPNTQVSDLVVEDHDLVVSTHGRSFWVMRDMGMLRELPDIPTNADAWLFQPRNSVRDFDNGVEIYYWLGEEADEVKIEFLDAAGNVLSETSSAGGGGAAAGGGGFGRGGGGGGGRVGADAGSHRYRWNMRLEGYTDFEGRIFWAAGNQGPEVVPGDYSVRLTVDGEVMERDFAIEMNPRSIAEGVTLADLQERFRFAIEIRDRVSQANEAVLRIRAIKREVLDRLEEGDNAELTALGTEVNSSLLGVEGEIYQVQNQSGQDPLNFPIKLNNKIAALLGYVDGSENAPTEQAYTVFNKLTVELDGQLESLQVILRQDLQRLNEMLRELGLDPIDLENLIT